MMFHNRLVYFAGGSAGPEAQKAPDKKAEAPTDKIDYSQEIGKYLENRQELTKLKKQVDYIVAQPEIQKSTHINVLKAVQEELDAYLTGKMPKVNEDLIKRFLEMSDTVLPTDMVFASIDASYKESSQGDSSKAAPGTEEAPGGEPAAQPKEAPKTRMEDQEAKWTSERMESEMNYLVDYYTQKGEQGKVDELMKIMTKVSEAKLAGQSVEQYQAEVAKFRPAEAEYTANFDKFYRDYLAYLAKNPKEVGGSTYAVPGVDVETPTGEQKEAPQGKLTDEELKWSRERLDSEVAYLTDYYTQNGLQDKVEALNKLGASIAEARDAGKGVDQYLAEVAKLRPAVPEYKTNLEKYYQDYLAYVAKNPKTVGSTPYAVPGIDDPSASK